MNVKQIHRLIADEKTKMTDAELFGSASYRSYLQSIVDNISGQYGRGAFVSLVYDAENPEAAYTDNRVIFINTANKLTNGFASRRLKNLCNIGMIGHETGHILFTDFCIAGRYSKYLSSGRQYPRKMTTKIFDSMKHKIALREFEELLSEGNQNKLRVLSMLAMRLSNIIEDGYVERQMKLRYPGTVALGIQLKNMKQADTAPSLQDMIDTNLCDISIIHNLLLQYSLSGRIENQEDVSNEYTDFLYDCIPVMDNALSEDNPKERMMAVNLLIIRCWRYIKPLMEMLDKEENDTSESSEESDSEGSSGSEAETAQSRAASELIGNLNEEMEASSEGARNMNTISLISSENIENSD